MKRVGVGVIQIVFNFMTHSRMIDSFSVTQAFLHGTMVSQMTWTTIKIALCKSVAISIFSLLFIDWLQLSTCGMIFDVQVHVAMFAEGRVA